MKINKRIIVFESDDWGSLRSNKIAFQNAIGNEKNKDYFFKFDTLERNEDLLNLCELLSKHVDCRGKNPCFTLNYAMANPLFDDIKKYNEYNYESVLETYSNQNVDFSLVKEMIEKGLIYPQLHCREHLNVHRWTQKIMNNDSESNFMLDNHIFSLASSREKSNRHAYMDAFNYDSKEEVIDLNREFEEAVSEFEETFGFKSCSFVAPCYIWGNHLEKKAVEKGIKFFQCGLLRYIPTNKKGTLKMKKELCYFMKKKKGLYYLVRNCYFEPSLVENRRSALNRCIKEIEYAFDHNMPAVICSHRINYVGGIKQENSENNLLLLDELLQYIENKYKNVYYMNSCELFDEYMKIRD